MQKQKYSRACHRGYVQKQGSYHEADLQKAAGAEDVLFYEERRSLRLVKSTKKAKPHLFLYAVMGAAVIAMGLCLVQYISLNSAVTYSVSRISELEETLQELKSENDEMENAIESSVSLDEIKYRAMTKLSMTYPSEDQVIYYLDLCEKCVPLLEERAEECRKKLKEIMGSLETLLPDKEQAKP